MKIRFVNSIFKFVTLALLVMLANQSVGQLCDRPDTVYIAFNFNNGNKDVDFIKSISEGKYIYKFGNGESEIFFSKSTETKIPYHEVDLLKISDLEELRKKEAIIIQCEIKKGEKTGKIYLDTGVNSVFKHIILIEKRGMEYYRSRVVWYDAIK